MSSKVGASVKGYIKNLTTNKTMKFQFNPESFEHSRGATYSEIVAPGMPYPLTQYAHGNARVFSIELFMFDKPSTGLIKKNTTFLEALLPPEDSPKSFEKPPEMLFAYCDFIKKCVLESLSVKHEEYDKSGNPTMTRFTLSLRQVGI